MVDVQSDQGNASMGAIASLLWTSAVLLLSSWVFELTGPWVMEAIERPHSVAEREQRLAWLLATFQFAKGMTVAFSTILKCSELGLDCEDTSTVGKYRDWYKTGGELILKLLISETLSVGLFDHGLRPLDVQLPRLVLSRFARTQAELNRLYECSSSSYFPARVALLFMMLSVGLAFSYALPLCYILILGFLCIAIAVDNSNLLRVDVNIPVTDERLIAELLRIGMPATLVLHCFMSLVFAHHIQLDFWGLRPEGRFKWFAWFVGGERPTINSPNVALAFAQLVGVVLFTAWFVVDEWRRQRDHDTRIRFQVGSQAIGPAMRGLVRATSRPMQRLYLRLRSGHLLPALRAGPRARRVAPTMEGATCSMPAGDAAIAARPVEALRVLAIASASTAFGALRRRCVGIMLDVERATTPGAPSTDSERGRALFAGDVSATKTNAPFRVVRLDGMSADLYCPPLTAELLRSVFVDTLEEQALFASGRKGYSVRRAILSAQRKLRPTSAARANDRGRHCESG